jgi:single-strand DNA-binding protein
MGKSVNKVILIGNVGKDPEIKSTAGGTLVANLSLATNERYKDKSGEWQDRTEWHNLAAYARGAEIMRDYVKKGSKLYIEGRITTRSWDDKDSGKKIYRTEIVVGDITLLSTSDRGDAFDTDNGKTQTAGRRDDRARNGSSRGNRRDEPQDDFAGTEITDNDIPF